MTIKIYQPIVLLGILLFCTSSFNPSIGDIIDQQNGVAIYYNGRSFKATHGRNTSHDGYNIGLKFQCVEFVKRYYYEYYGHKMPSAGGNAKDFFNRSLPDKAFNTARGLMQYRNVRTYLPQSGDLLVYGSYPGNPFGHVAIISEVGNDFVEIVQQNMGSRSRERLKLVKYLDYYTVADYNVLGWLRKE